MNVVLARTERETARITDRPRTFERDSRILLFLFLFFTPTEQTLHAIVVTSVSPVCLCVCVSLLSSSSSCIRFILDRLRTDGQIYATRRVREVRSGARRVHSDGSQLWAPERICFRDVRERSGLRKSHRGNGRQRV